MSSSSSLSIVTSITKQTVGQPNYDYMVTQVVKQIYVIFITHRSSSNKDEWPTVYKIPAIQILSQQKGHI